MAGAGGEGVDKTGEGVKRYNLMVKKLINDGDIIYSMGTLINNTVGNLGQLLRE